MSAVWVGEIFFVKDTLGHERHRLRAVPLGVDRWGWRSARCCCRGGWRRRRSRRVGLAAARSRARRSPSRPCGSPSASSSPARSSVGSAHGVKNVMFRSLIHVRVPERLHGRAFAAYNGIRNGAELGAFAAGGLLVAAIGPAGTLAYAGGLSALAGCRAARPGADEPRLGLERPDWAAGPGDFGGHRRGEGRVNERQEGSRGGARAETTGPTCSHRSGARTPTS